MLQRLKQWQRRRIVRHHPMDSGAWGRATAGLAILQGLSAQELERLRFLATLFVHQKRFYGVRETTVTRDMQAVIAAQACLPVLNLGIDYYRGWYSVICYQDAFIARHEHMDEAGVVHASQRVLTGEAWEGGPVILSLGDAMPGVEPFGTGTNVVIHEMAHKLDMLTGQANGLPPLHPTMSTTRWAAIMSTAFVDLRRRLRNGEASPFDPYAAENPAEFFAVMSEYFFAAPASLADAQPEVYGQMAAFYRQNPAARHTRAAQEA